jgi:hypothetical protein
VLVELLPAPVLVLVPPVPALLLLVIRHSFVYLNESFNV